MTDFERNENKKNFEHLGTSKLFEDRLDDDNWADVSFPTIWADDGTPVCRVLGAAQTNPFYNPDLCNNGGGYDQPMFVLEFHHGKKIWRAEVYGSSVGDFGSSYGVVAFSNRGERLSADWGSAIDDEYSDFSECSREHCDILNCINSVLGFYVPTREKLDTERA